MSHQRNDTESAKTTERNSGRRAWDGNAPHADAARQRILEAAARCIAREGPAATTIAAIAAEAGVSRQTIYRYFKSRDQVVLRSIRAAAERIREIVGLRIQTLADPADMIVETLVLVLDELRNDTVMAAITDPSRIDTSVTSRFTTRPGIEWLRETLAPAIEAASWSEADATVALEVILRMFLSLIMSPSPERTPDELRAFLYRHLIPGLGLALTEEL